MHTYLHTTFLDHSGPLHQNPRRHRRYWLNSHGVQYMMCQKSKCFRACPKVQSPIFHFIGCQLARAEAVISIGSRKLHLQCTKDEWTDVPCVTTLLQPDQTVEGRYLRLSDLEADQPLFSAEPTLAKPADSPTIGSTRLHA